MATTSVTGRSIKAGQTKPVNLAEVKATRDLIEKHILALPGYQFSSIMTPWVSGPPAAAAAKVRQQVVEKLAYEAWEKAGGPHGQDLHFWNLGEESFKTACQGWLK